MSNSDALLSIDPTTLEDVTGGVTGASASSGKSQVATLLEGLESSIKDLASNRGNNNSALTQLLPFLLMSKGGAGGGACPCGCGMANCIRR